MNSPSIRHARRMGGAKFKVLLFLAVLVALVGLAPTIVSNSPLRNILLASAVPQGAVQISSEAASVGWLSAGSVSGIEMRDPQGALVMTAASVEIDRSLLSLVNNRRQLGTIRVHQPVLYLMVRPDGSNLEDVFARLATGELESPNPAVAPGSAKDSTSYAIEMTGGTILAEDQTTGRRWRIDGVNFTYDATTVGPMKLAIQGQFATGWAAAGGAVPPGGFVLSMGPSADGRQQLSWEAASVPLDAAGPWLARWVSGTQMAGTLSGKGTAAWTPSMNFASHGAGLPADLATTGALRIEALQATAPILAGDRLQLARVECPWRLAAAPGGWSIEQMEINSELGQVAVRGLVDPAAFNTTQPLPAVSQHNVEMRGSVDLAQLATMLPQALRIRTDTKIDSGAIQFVLRQQASGGGQAISGSLQAAELAATSAGRPLSWEEPIHATFAVRRMAGATRLESLVCQSDFLQISAAGTPDELSATAQFDLSRLANQLGQFVDLSSVQLAGSGNASGQWRRTAGEQFTANARGELSQLRVALGDGSTWAEPQLTVQAQAAGVLDPTTSELRQVASGRLQLAGQGDSLDAALTAPVEWNDAAVWPVTVRATGNVARWLTRVRPWFSADPWILDGTADVTATARGGRTGVDVSHANIVLTNLHAVGPGWTIDEPRVELSGDGRWDQASGTLATRQAQLICSSLSLLAKDVQVRSSEHGLPQMTGVAAVRADLGRVATWRAAPAEMPRWYPKGEFNGNVHFSQQADRLTAELSGNATNLMLAEWKEAVAGRAAGYQTIWQESQLALKASALYEPSADRLSVRQAQVQSQTLEARADAQIDGVTTVADVRASGTVNYDLAQVTPLLRPYLGDGIVLTGRDQARFEVSGRLGGSAPGVQLAGYNDTAPVHWSRRLQGRVEMPWSSADVYGLEVGAGKVAAVLGGGVVQFDPLAVAVGQGRLDASPRVQLDPRPAELAMAKGPVLTNVRISPEVSEEMLKYIAPVLAGATQTEGLFSMQLDGARVPLDQPRRADIGGQMVVHSVQVLPGPMAKQWIGLGQQIEAIIKSRDPQALAARPASTLLSISDQTVNFRVVEERVYHQGLQFQVGDVTCSTSGSVGLDESLSLVLRVPIQDKWIGSEQLLAGLKGQSLEIPISGTLSRPQMDQSAIAQLSQMLLRSAAESAIGNELNRAIDKLFNSR